MSIIPLFPCYRNRDPAVRESFSSVRIRARGGDHVPPRRGVEEGAKGAREARHFWRAVGGGLGAVFWGGFGAVFFWLFWLFWLFWVGFGWALGGLWVGFGWALGGLWVGFGWALGPCSRERLAKGAKRSRSQGGAQRFFAKERKNAFFEERAKILKTKDQRPKSQRLKSQDTGKITGKTLETLSPNLCRGPSAPRPPQQWGAFPLPLPLPSTPNPT
ncbi:hypothetical protein SIID45300_02660 [Candidatus Magnetaquicoccaceae bacterium FCR-1]|uniref:Uncharacterized protein n=1 Tax=Candidatus Magnetaquiglobus chichijimensis TaxID=3141448 RepID=A0ABQ0CBR5_9PROT